MRLLEIVCNRASIAASAGLGKGATFTMRLPRGE
jgi:hypothetical protein